MGTAVPTFDQVSRWNARTMRLNGASIHMGAQLLAAFAAADLPEATGRVEALRGRAEAGTGVLLRARNLARSLLPAMERLGVATVAEVDLDTLLERMQKEADSTNSVLVGHLEVGAWCHV